jgi:hypothetical protein
MNARERWVAATRTSTARALHRIGIPMSAAALEGNLDIDRWTSIGPLMRTQREISAALRWLIAEGYAKAVEDRDQLDPPGRLYVLTEQGNDFATTNEPIIEEQ